MSSSRRNVKTHYVFNSYELSRMKYTEQIVHYSLFKPPNKSEQEANIRKGIRFQLSERVIGAGKKNSNFSSVMAADRASGEKD